MERIYKMKNKEIGFVRIIRDKCDAKEGDQNGVLNPK